MSSQEMQWLLKEKYHGEKTAAFFDDCRKLALGEPLAYLIGHTPFLTTTIHLDSRPLVPRPETEYWVEKAIMSMRTKQAEQLIAEPQVLSVLDLCAGSGCIGVAVAAALPHTHVTFSEIDVRHLDTIKKNCEYNHVPAERIALQHTSLFDNITDRFDFILSNPPYIDSTLNRVDPSVRDFEPHLALFGGARGLEVIAAIITAAPAHLTPAGQLWLEHEPEQVNAITDLASAAGFSITTECDQYNVPRYSILMLY
jgi:release factor glutamine methyltransferase